MNQRRIKSHLDNKINEWLESISDESIRNIAKENVIVTGGSITSLLIGEEPKDYDMYFKTKESCFAVAQYYANIFNTSQGMKTVIIKNDKNDRVECFISSVGIAKEDGSITEDPFNYEEGDIVDNNDGQEPFVQEDENTKKNKLSKYRPIFFSTNAITLSNKIQIVIRFFGSLEEIHTNFDYVHCTCAYDYNNHIIDLPAKALESIINKELIYIGSKYPLCSIIRTRKFINRGWWLNAGQYVKMALQLNEFNLKDRNTFIEQLTGVDSAYFNDLISLMDEDIAKDPDLIIDSTYLINAINVIFDEVDN